MKKIVLETKAALGVAPKTVDTEYDAKSADVKAVEHATAEYSSAMERLKGASSNLVSGFEHISKAFEMMTSAADIPEYMKVISHDYASQIAKAHNEYIAEYKKTIDSDSSTTEIKKLISDCKTKEGKRARAMAEYDTYREVVSKKEAEYSKKGKSLTDSKHYNEEVSKRDSLKEEFEKADKEFKDHYAELEAKKLASYAVAMKTYFDSTWKFFNSIERDLAETKAKVEKGNS